jgi:hypothetical protein
MSVNDNSSLLSLIAVGVLPAWAVGPALSASSGPGVRVGHGVNVGPGAVHVHADVKTRTQITASCRQYRMGKAFLRKLITSLKQAL